MGLCSNPVKEFASSQFLPESSLDTLNACALISETHIVDLTHLLIIGRSDMTRKEATDAILKAKREKLLTWEAIASIVGGHTVWVASVFLGQNSMSPDQAAKVASVLGLTDITFQNRCYT